MIKTNKLFLILVTEVMMFFVFSVIHTNLSAQEKLNNEAPAEVRSAAIKGLPTFLKTISKDDIKNYGFSKQEEVEHATLSDPFKVYTIEPEKILDYDDKTSVLEIISPTSLWEFPVMSKGTIRTLLTVDLMNGIWEAVGIGSSGLAKRWDFIMKNWPSVEGYEHIFVRVYQADSDFVILKHAGKIEMLSLMPWYGTEENKTYEPSYILLRLQDSIRSNIK